MTKIVPLRNRAYLAQNGRCYYCRLPMWQLDPIAFAQRHRLTPKQAMRLQCTAEHKVARQDGGRDTAENIVAACAHCNHTRHRAAHALSSDAFREKVRRRIERRRWHDARLFVSGLTASGG